MIHSMVHDKVPCLQDLKQYVSQYQLPLKHQLLPRSQKQDHNQVQKNEEQYVEISFLKLISPRLSV